MVQKNILGFLWTQRQGAIIGALWGLLSCFGALGMASSNMQLLWWQKLIIMPAYLSGILVSNDMGWPILILPILIGAGIGMLVDMVYLEKI